MWVAATGIMLMIFGGPVGVVIGAGIFALGIRNCADQLEERRRAENRQKYREW